MRFQTVSRARILLVIIQMYKIGCRILLQIKKGELYMTLIVIEFCSVLFYVVIYALEC